MQLIQVNEQDLMTKDITTLRNIVIDVVEKHNSTMEELSSTLSTLTKQIDGLTKKHSMLFEMLENAGSLHMQATGNGNYQAGRDVIINNYYNED